VRKRFVYHDAGGRIWGLPKRALDREGTLLPATILELL
jgi:hypothetical protein